GNASPRKADARMGNDTVKVGPTFLPQFIRDTVRGELDIDETNSAKANISVDNVQTGTFVNNGVGIPGNTRIRGGAGDDAIAVGLKKPVTVNGGLFILPAPGAAAAGDDTVSVGSTDALVAVRGDLTVNASLSATAAITLDNVITGGRLDQNTVGIDGTMTIR